MLIFVNDSNIIMISVGHIVEARIPGSRSYSDGLVLAVEKNFYTIKFNGGAEHNVVHQNVRFKRTRETLRTERYRSRSRSRGRLEDSTTFTPEVDRRTTRRRTFRTSTDDQDQLLDVYRLTPTVMLQNILQFADENDSKRPAERGNIMDDSDNSTIISTDLPLYIEQEDARGSVHNYSEEEGNPEFISETESNASTRISMTASNRNVYGNVRNSPDLLKSNNDTGDQSTNSETKEKLQDIIYGKSEQLSNEFGGCIGISFLTILVPSIIFYLSYMCNSVSCNFQKPNFSEWPKLNTFFSYEALAVFVGLNLLITIVSSIPWFGYKMKWIYDKNIVLKYNSNGFFSLWLILVISGTLIYKNIPILSIIEKNYIQLLLLCIINAFVSSLFLYLRSSHEQSDDQINLYGKPNIIKGFWFGYELNPRLFNIIDIKLIQYRVSYILLFIFQLIYIYNDLKLTIPASLTVDDIQTALSSMEYSPTLVTMAALNVLFVADLAWFEYQIPTTFEFQQEGMGFMLAIKYAIYPFLKTLPIKYVFEHAIVVPSSALLLTVNFYILGFILYRFSNLMKNLFRTHPLDAHFTYSDSLHTLLGKRLLVTHTWGFVRHPNYLGHIIMIMALAIPLLWARTWIPLIPPVLGVLYMIYRALRDNERCKVKYGASWERYCYRVKYILFPKIF